MSMKKAENEDFDEDVEKEKRKISELFQELKTKGEKEDDKLTWMYKNPSESVNREDYLLGRSVDKALDSASGRDTSQPQPNELSNFPRKGKQPARSQADQAELQRKLHEDPLFAIQQKEIDARKKLLSNPVKMKEVKRIIEAEKKKKLRAEKKFRKQQRRVQRENKLNLLLIKELRKHGDKMDFQSMLESSDESSSSSESEVERKKRKRKKKTKNVSESSDDESEDDRSRRRDKKKIKPERNKKESAKVGSREKSKSDSKFSKSREHRVKTKNVTKKKKSNRSESDDSDNSDRKKSKKKVSRKSSSSSSSSSSSKSDSSDVSSDDDKKKKRKQTESKDEKKKAVDSAKEGRSRDMEERTYYQYDGDSPKRRKTYGLSTLDGMQPDKSEKRITPYKKKEEEKQKVESRKPLRLSEKEKQAQLKEMMENAKWRKKERELDYLKHKKAKQREEKIEDYDESFMKNQLSKMSRHGSMADRIKSNINNIQRSKSSMDNNFVRK